MMADTLPPTDPLVLTALRDLSAALETTSRLLDERATRADSDRQRMDVALADLAREIATLQRELDKIVQPVVDHYTTLRRAQEEEHATGVRWGAFFTTYLTPERVGRVVRYAAAVLTLLGLGGGIGANFRGCSGALLTAADAPVSTDQATHETHGDERHEP